ncbi:MAG: acetyl-CoA carboxylase biotin carboxyl carrier protein [Candidatus Limnocylindrales bacterium]
MDEGKLGAELGGADEPTVQAAVLGAASAADDAAGRIARLADELLPALIARLDASGLSALEVRTDAWRIRLKKPHGRRQSVARGAAPGAHPIAHPSAHPIAHAASQPVAHPALPPAAAIAGAALRGPVSATAGGRGAPRVAASPASPGASPADPHPEAMASSPAVGYFTPREGTIAGSRVRAGEVLGFVDVLGIRQDVCAPIDGEIERLLAQAGEAVEYGQPLVRIEPTAPLPASALDLPEAP